MWGVDSYALSTNALRYSGYTGLDSLLYPWDLIFHLLLDSLFLQNFPLSLLVVPLGFSTRTLFHLSPPQHIYLLLNSILKSWLVFLLSTSLMFMLSWASLEVFFFLGSFLLILLRCFWIYVFSFNFLDYLMKLMVVLKSSWGSSK